MSYWMYHKLTGSTYPVPTDDDTDVAKLADSLPNRIYFEAELTTAPVETTHFVVVGPDGSATRFDNGQDAVDYWPEGGDLYAIQGRKEGFNITVTEDNYKEFFGDYERDSRPEEIGNS